MTKPHGIALALLTVSLLLLCLGNGEGQTERGGIHVEINPQKPSQLHVTLRSRADKRVAIYKSQVPWATRYSMVLVAVKGDGQCLEKVLAVEDPPVGRISLEPREVLSGDLNLQQIFKGLDKARKESVVHLFWAYRAPGELNIGRWSGGWILIPQDPTE